MSATNHHLPFVVHILVLCLGVLPVTQAGNNSSISDAPIGKFSEEDMNLMNANIDATVADEKVRVVRSWSNPHTSHSGTAETLVAYAGPNGVPCKRVSVANRAGSLTGKGQYTLCKMPEQGWKFVPNEFAPAPKAKDANK